MKQDQRFEIIHEETIGSGYNIKIFRDNVTGVQYLWTENGMRSSMTVHVDKEGKPISS